LIDPDRMKCSTSILSAILFAGICHAQDAPVKAASSRFHIGIQGSVDHAYRALELNQRNGFSERIAEDRDRLEQARLGCTGTFFVGYAFNARLGLEAGVGYGLRGWQLDVSKLTLGDQMVPRRGFIHATDDSLKAARRSFHYLDVPVRGTLTLGNGPFRWITTAGISMNILLKATSTVVIGEHSTTKVDGYRTISLSPTVSTGLLYDLGSKGAMRIEPTLCYGLLDLRNNNPIGERLWSAGLMLSYVYRS
jgi:hypothetical protein